MSHDMTALRGIEGDVEAIVGIVADENQGGSGRERERKREGEREVNKVHVL